MRTGPLPAHGGLQSHSPCELGQSTVTSSVACCVQEGASLLRTALLSVSCSDSDSIFTTPDVSKSARNRCTAPWSICAMRFVPAFPCSLGGTRAKFFVAIDTTVSSPATSTPHRGRLLLTGLPSQPSLTASFPPSR